MRRGRAPASLRTRARIFNPRSHYVLSSCPRCFPCIFSNPDSHPASKCRYIIPLRLVRGQVGRGSVPPPGSHTERVVSGFSLRLPGPNPLFFSTSWLGGEPPALSVPVEMGRYLPPGKRLSCTSWMCSPHGRHRRRSQDLSLGLGLGVRGARLSLPGGKNDGLER